MILDTFLQFLEKKDHLIKRHNTLTDEQKDEIIRLLNKFPDKEHNFDWNNLQNITYEDFMNELSQVSKTQKKKQVKSKGVEGLIKGKDYDIIYNQNNVIGYVPLNYEASKLLASRFVGSCEGKWCTAYQKTPAHWNEYIEKGIVIAYYIDFDKNSSWEKIAVAYEPEPRDEMKIFDKDDNHLDIYEVREIIPDFEKYFWEYLNQDHPKPEEAPEPIKQVSAEGEDLNREMLASIAGIEENPDGTLSAMRVNLNDENLKSFGDIQFKEAWTFMCEDNKLKTLEGAPEKVFGVFSCARNKLTSLVGGPKYADEYRANDNNLNSLEGQPEFIDGNFDLRGNPNLQSQKISTKISGKIITDPGIKIEGIQVKSRKNPW